MRSIVLLTAAAAVSGCVSQPVVSDFNGDSVKIQSDAFLAPKQSAETDAEALRICRAGGKRRAEYASTRQLPNYISEHLYLCLN
ncbi:MAG: hypothetical protein JXR75_13775 [Rhodobacteraceae bacterium]|nr:hypothetical protein [Paracoccaceae bacterium]